MLKRLWNEDEGVLTLEWIILTTLVVIGVIAGLAAVRDALVHELGGVVGATSALDQTWEAAPPIGISVGNGNPNTCQTSVAGSFEGMLDTSGYGTGRINTLYGQTLHADLPVVPCQ